MKWSKFIYLPGSVMLKNKVQLCPTDGANV